ncbi:MULTISPECIES: hypothetical protein [Actinomadura]|uniref:Uncharacterized protein n=1 Tax=Actinomadura yumaensis TaxID=111807 RepID=A0ABW2CYV0_9ACTN|nr:hypothetical protein [Actinomadura sp. J1-007]MWK36444.1 hypothetical protein [Actinomadura sp. J1-007]
MNSDSLLLVAIPVGSALFAGIVTYGLVGRGFRGGGRAAVALASAALVGVASVFVLYLAVAAFLACMVFYLVVRFFLRPPLALVLAGIVLLGGLSTAVMIMAVALSRM